MGIKEYKWSDSNIIYVHSFTAGGTKGIDFIELEIQENDYGYPTALDFNKEDAVAIAKHFKLTDEDLK